MSIMRSLLISLLALVLLATGASTLAGSASAQAAPTKAASAKQQVVFYQLGSEPALMRPKKIFTAFNSSPTYKKLQWKKWGTKHAVAKGVFDDTCASCGGGKYKGKVYFNGFKKCADAGTTVYRKARGTYRVDGELKRIKLYSNCPNPS